MNALEWGLAPPLEAVLLFHFLEARENLKLATLELGLHGFIVAEARDEVRAGVCSSVDEPGLLERRRAGLARA